MCSTSAEPIFRIQELQARANGLDDEPAPSVELAGPDDGVASLRAEVARLQQQLENLQRAAAIKPLPQEATELKDARAVELEAQSERLRADLQRERDKSARLESELQASVDKLDELHFAFRVLSERLQQAGLSPVVGVVNIRSAAPSVSVVSASAPSHSDEHVVKFHGAALG